MVRDAELDEMLVAEQRRLLSTLRQLADRLEEIPVSAIDELLVRLSVAMAELERAARLVCLIGS
jgi:hypothetical protein